MSTILKLMLFSITTIRTYYTILKSCIKMFAYISSSPTSNQTYPFSCLKKGKCSSRCAFGFSVLRFAFLFCLAASYLWIALTLVCFNPCLNSSAEPLTIPISGCIFYLITWVMCKYFNKTMSMFLLKILLLT